MNCNWAWWFGIQIFYNLMYMVPLIVSYIVLLGCWDKNSDESPCIDCSFVCLRVLCVAFACMTVGINLDVMFRFWLAGNDTAPIFMYYKKVVVLQNWINFIMLCAGGSYSSWAAYEQWGIVKDASKDKEAYQHTFMYHMFCEGALWLFIFARLVKYDCGVWVWMVNSLLVATQMGLLAFFVSCDSFEEVIRGNDIGKKIQFGEKNRDS
jgi:hypothetical protein